ncbi:MAG: acyl carrier protein [Bacteroidota bacterium]
MKTKDTLIQFIQSDLIDDDQPISSDEDLLTTGLIDSVRVMRLVSFVGEAFSIEIPPEDMTIDHFISVDAICAYVASKQS